jgi:uncharacterized DUF497 family protein
MIDFSSVTGFEWDDGNRDKNWKKYQVSNGECEEVFFNLPLLLKPDPTHSQAEDRYYVLGQTNAGRRLFVSFTIRGENIRVISARDMSKRERNFHEQAYS